MLNMNFLWELTTVIPQLSCPFIMANAVLWTIVLVNSETSDSVNSGNLPMCAFSSKCFCIELVPCSEE